MSRPTFWIALVSLPMAAMIAGIANADGLPVLGVDVGGVGVVTASGKDRFVTVPAGHATVLAQVRPAGGRVVRSLLLRGSFTIPAVAYDGSPGGLSADGSTLVLIQPRSSFPRAQTALMVVDAWNLQARRLIRLRGDFSFDAISPRGSLLYLIDYVAPGDPNRYVVRVYDVDTGRLLAKPVTDPRNPGEKMRGSPLTRVSSPDGRWAYTLYDGAGKTPFVHALDTSTHSARCIDLDTLAGTDLTGLRLSTDRAADTITISRKQQPLVVIDTHTFLARATAAPDRSFAGTVRARIAFASLAGLLTAGATAFALLHHRRRRLVERGWTKQETPSTGRAGL